MCTISATAPPARTRTCRAHGIAYDAWAGTLQPVVDDEGFTPHPRPGEHRHHRRAPRSAPSAILAALRAREEDRRGRVHGGRAVRQLAAYFDWYRIETWKGYDDYPDESSPGTRATTTSGVRPGLGGMWEGRALPDTTSRPTATSCSWRRSRPSGRTSARASAAWTCSRSGRARPSPTTRSATRSCRPILRDIFRTKTTQEWIEFADEHNTTIAPANTRRRCSTTRSSRTASRGCRTTTPAPTCCCSRCTSRARSCRSRTKAPEVGEHTDEVLRNVLGYDDAKITALREAGRTGLSVREIQTGSFRVRGMRWEGSTARSRSSPVRARGQGETEARRFVQEGARVVLADMLDDEGRPSPRTSVPTAVFVHVDVSQEHDWVDVMEAAAGFGPLTCCVNNASIPVLQADRGDVGRGLPARHDREPGGHVPRDQGGDRRRCRSGGGSIINMSSIDGIGLEEQPHRLLVVEVRHSRHDEDGRAGARRRTASASTRSTRAASTRS